MKQHLPASALVSRLRLLKLEPRMLFDGAAMAEGMLVVDRTEPPQPAPEPENDANREAEVALLAQEPEEEAVADVATTQRAAEENEPADEGARTTGEPSASEEAYPVSDNDAAYASEADERLVSEGDETDDTQAAASTADDLDGELESQDSAPAYRELVVIDSRVENHENLLVDMPSHVSVRVIGIEEDGLAVIGSELASGERFNAVHIISHGVSGGFTLGRDTVDSNSLSSHSETLQAWSPFLTAEADILLYGCDIAAGQDGQDFLREISRLTGADIAASTDATGAADRGGNWVLEAQVGSLETGVVLSALATEGYAGLLAATAVVDANAAGSRTTAEDTALAITGVQVSGDSPADIITLSVVTAGGTSTFGSVAGLSLTGSNGSSSFSVTGTIANVNTALGSLTYTPTENQNSSTAGFSPEITFNVTAGGVGSVVVSNISVTAVNDAPDLSTQVNLVVSEGGNSGLSLAQLATSGAALDADIDSGQQVIEQQMVQITSLPTQGTLTYQGGVVVVGTVVPVSSLAQLVYTHDGTDLTADASDSFGVNVADGGGGVTPGTIGITIQPANVAPVITGAPSLIEGQVAVVAPTIDLGDVADSLATSTIVIDNIVTGGQGTFFFDANNNNVVDAGEALSGSVTLTSIQAADIASQLKFAHNGAEPNDPAAIDPSYRITVTDSGGATGVPSGPVSETLTLDVAPNNDDPTLTNIHSTPGTALGVEEGITVTITSGMLQANDVDRNPANTAQTTPSNQLVYTIGTRPTEGEIQVNVGGGLGPEGNGWIVLGDGGRFTQAQVDAGEVRYYQTTEVAIDTLDGFTFTVRDSAFGFDVITDPANPTSGREGGIRDTPTGAIALQNFYFNVQADPDLHENPYTGPPRPATAGFGGPNMIYTFAPGAMSNGNGGATWNEANVGTAGGYVITDGMLSYQITRTDTQGTPDGADDISVVVPPEETVFTLTTQAPNGTVERFVGGAWQEVPTNGQFTQADINSGSIRFVHDGGEDHTSTFGYTVSDGTPNNFQSSFAVDVTPTNDRPTGSGGTAQVLEGLGNSVRLGTAVVGLADIDLSEDAPKRVGDGAADFLWFRVTELPDQGDLQRWNGSAWVDVDSTEWLPSTLLTASVDGGTSGLRYVHDGSEPLTYVGGPRVDFTYLVRDDLGNPGDPFDTNITAPALTDGTQQSNQSAPVQAIVNIIPVNDGPQIADRPGDADPAIGATITDGGALAGANQILANIPEGSTSIITSAFLTAVDPDNTTVQRQYRVTEAPTEGVLLLNGSALGVGSTFTQADIDANRLSYRHGGNEVGALIAGFGAQYHDKFNFVVNDGVLQDTGADANNNVFLITLSPTNDKPTVTVPDGPVNIDGSASGNNLIPGVSVSDPDIADGLISGETDFLQVTVRLLNPDGTPLASYSDVNGSGGGVSIGFATPADTSGLWAVTQNGVDNILQVQGTRAQVNAALAGLSVTFAADLDAEFELQVIADDRIRNAAGVLDASGSDANGGELNQSALPSGAPTAVPNDTYNWLTQVTLPADDPNISADTVAIRASSVNDPAVLTGPASVVVNEDIRTQISGFVVEDPESAAFDTPVTVTVSVPGGSGTLGVGGAGAQSSITPSGGQSVTISGDNTGTLVLTGRASDIEALLNGRNVADNANDANGGLFFTSALNANGDVNGGAAGDVTLTLSLDDSGSRIGGDVGAGSVANNPASITTAVTITAINDAPVVAGGGAAIPVSGSGAVAVGGFQVSDVDSNDGYTEGETDGVIQVTVRLLDNLGAPLAASAYDTLGVTLDSTTAGGSGATVDATLAGIEGALEVRGTLSEINAYLAGLQVSFGSIGDSNLDTTYAIEVVADDRLRDRATGALTDPGTPAANGGLNNQQAGVPAVPATDTLNPYSTTVAAYGVYNVTSNTRDLFISSVNDPGQITANNVTVSEGSATLVLNAANANILLSDPDDNGATNMEVTVTVGVGTITAVGGAGGSVAGVGTNTITITGATEAQINSRLQALTVTFPDPDAAGPAAAADWNGTFDVTVVYDDKGNTGTRPNTLVGDTDDPRTGGGDFSYVDGAGGTSNNLVTTRILTVTVDPVNDAPTATTGTVTLPAETEDTDGTANTVGSLFGGTFADAVDDAPPGSVADELAGIAITGNASVAGQGTWEYSTDGGATWLTIPAVSEASAFLIRATDPIRFNPADNFHGTPGSLTVRLVDDSAGAITTGNTANVAGGNSGGTTPYSSAANAITLGTTVTNVNDRPTGADSTLLSTTEDTASPPGDTVANLFTPGYSDATDNQASTAGGGNAATPLGGIAIVGNASDPATEGVWQYNTGSGWVNVGVPAGTSALVLPPDASLRFVPVANYNGTPGSLTVRLADTAQAFASGTNISGAIGPTSTWSETVTLDTTVAPANDTPALTHTATNPTATESTNGTGVPPVNLLSTGTLSDIDLSTTPGLNSGIFGAGTVTVTLTDGIAGDQLLVDPAVTAGVAGVAGGSAGTPLVITLTSDATTAQVEAVLAAIQYRHTTSNPTVFGTDLTRAYTVVVSDGNNAQAGGDAGGPGSLSAPVINGTITLSPYNDPPVATDNTNSVTEDAGVPATGNVITGGTPDSDPDTPVGDLRVTGIRTGTEAAGGTTTTVSGATVVVGQYGTLTINPDGTYSYELDNNNADVDALLAGETLNDVFTYTLSDGTSVDLAQLTITIDGRNDPRITLTDNNGLDPGQSSIPENATTPVTGGFTITSPDGVDELALTVGGTTTTISSLQLNDLAANPVVIAGEEGVLTLTAFNPTTGVVTYSYQQDGTTQDHSGGANSVTDTFAVVLTDTNGVSSAPRDLVILITDTAPTALPDTNAVDEGRGTAATTTSGNVFSSTGASGGDVEDTLGADPTEVVGVGSGTSTGSLSGNLGTPFSGVYGSIVLNADGSYTYTLNNSNPAVQRLNNGQTLTETFRYTIRDSDGNESTTTLTITIRGVSDTPAVPPEVQAPAPAPLSIAPDPVRPTSGDGRLPIEVSRNEIRFQRLDIDQIADRLRPTLWVLPAVQEAQDILPGQLGNADLISDIMDPSLYVLPTVAASSRETRDAALPAIERFNKSDTDDNGTIVQWSAAEESTPSTTEQPPQAEAVPPSPEPLAAPKAAAPSNVTTEPAALAPPLARVEFTEQVRQWAGANSIRQRAAELDLLFVAPTPAEASSPEEVADSPQT
jgi:VCBS repeat-containing protein